MVHDPLSLLDSLMVALSGFVIVFLMLAVLWGIILIVSQVVGGMAKPVPAAAPAAAAPAPAVKKAPAPAPLPVVPLVPEIELGKGVDESEAACVMAIVCYETGIPVNELIFKSIKVKGESNK